MVYHGIIPSCEINKKGSSAPTAINSFVSKYLSYHVLNCKLVKTGSTSSDTDESACTSANSNCSSDSNATRLGTAEHDETDLHDDAFVGNKYVKIKYSIDEQLSDRGIVNNCIMDDGLVGCDINENNVSSERNAEAAVLRRNIQNIT